MFDAAYHILCLRLGQFDWLVGGPEQRPKLRKLWYACQLLCRRQRDGSCSHDATIYRWHMARERGVPA